MSTTTLDWRAHAACRGMDVALFMTNHPTEAKKVCDRCPVQAACLWDAIVIEADDYAQLVVGLRGGLTAPRRVRLARRYTRDEQRARLVDELARLERIGFT